MTTQHEQRSPEWFKQRVGRVTGSSVGAILGLSPFATREDVLRRMVREYHGAASEFEGNIATQWGNNHEDEAITDYCRHTKNFVDEAYFTTYEDWLGASPDGLIDDDGLLEVKSPFGKRNSADFLSINEQPHYYAQINVQLFCTNRAWCDFWQWSKVGHSLERVYRDDEWLAQNIPALKQFHAEYLSELSNDDHLQPLRKEINTAEVKLLLDEYDQLKDAAALAQERQKEVLQEIVTLSGENNALLHGRKLTKVVKNGSVSYAKVVKDHCSGIDLEPYTGKASESWRLS